MREVIGGLMIKGLSVAQAGGPRMLVHAATQFNEIIM
jgi:hypothetical protein